MLNQTLMEKAIIVASAAIILAAGAATCWTVFGGNEDEFFNENLEALMNGEGTPVSTCFIDGASGIGYTHGLFCDSQTTTDMIYTCGSESYGRPAGTSMCTKKL